MEALRFAHTIFALSSPTDPSMSMVPRRRLPTIVVSLRMAQNLKTAITFIEQGRILYGPDDNDEGCDPQVDLTNEVLSGVASLWVVVFLDCVSQMCE